jgi:hypothetical protein
VFLRPLMLPPRPGEAEEITLSPAGEMQLNPVLQHVLAHRGAGLDERELLGPAGAPFAAATAFGRLRQACAELPGFAVDGQVLCGAFSYVKEAMVADVEDVEVLGGSDLVAALAGDPGAVAAVRGALGPSGGGDPDRRPVGREHLVLDADASQVDVVDAALRRAVPVDTHHPAALAALVRHVRSDGVLRTREEELGELITELGYRKRGRRIVATLTAAQRAAGEDGGPVSDGRGVVGA